MVSNSFAAKARDAFARGLGEFGFLHLEGPYFGREREGWSEIVFPNLLRFTKKAFTVSYGLDFPPVRHSLSSIPDAGSLGLFVARELKHQKFYSFEGRDISEQCQLAIRDLEFEALPWFASFHTAIDAVDAFFRERIIPRQDADVPDPRGWAIFGLLLFSFGQDQQAQSWLCKAIEELERPWFSKGGRLLRERVSGARVVRQEEFDIQLLQLLRTKVAGP